MGTADYGVLVTLLLAGYIALSIRQEEKRGTERRQRALPPPGGQERRSGRDRRDRSLAAYLGWAVRTPWRRLRNLF